MPETLLANEFTPLVLQMSENGEVAEAMLKKARPWVKLNSVQRHLVEKVGVKP